MLLGLEGIRGEGEGVVAIEWLWVVDGGCLAGVGGGGELPLQRVRAPNFRHPSLRIARPSMSSTHTTTSASFLPTEIDLF